MLKCIIKKNATIMPCINSIGGIWCEGKPVVEGLSSGMGFGGAGPGRQAPYIENLSSDIYDEGIYCGGFKKHFGHFIIECLSRLWYAKKFPDIPLIWLASGPFLNWQQDILEILGISNPSVFINRPTLVKKIHIPSPGILLTGWMEDEYLDFISCFPSKIPQPDKKLYLSRTKFNGYDYQNEQEIESILRENNWLIYYPECHSINDQLNEISSSEVVLGIESSAFHSILLLKNLQSKIFTFNRINSQLYQQIAGRKKINYFSTYCSIPNKEKVPVNLINYIFDIDLFKKIMFKTHYLSVNIHQIQEIKQVDIEKLQNIEYKNPNITKTFFNYYLGVYFSNKGNCKEANTYFEKAIFDLQKCKGLIQQYNFNFFLNSCLSCGYKDSGINIYNLIKNTLKNIDFHHYSLILCYAASYYYKINDPTTSFELFSVFLGNIKKYKIRNLFNHKYKYITQFFSHFLNFKEGINYIKNQDTDHVDYFLTLSFLYEQLHDYKSAQKILLKGIAVFEDNLKIKMRYAQLLRTMHHYEESQNILNKLLDENTNSTDICINVSISYEDIENITEAIDWAQKAVEKDPENPNVKARLANLLRNKGELALAWDIMEKCIKQFPYWSEPYAQFAAIHDAKNQIDEAIACACKAVAMDPYNLSRRNQLSALYRKKGDFQSAVLLMNDALKLNPYWSEPHIQLSIIFDAMGDIEAALTSAQKAIELDPYNLSRKAHFINLLRKKGDFAEARFLLEKYKERYPWWSEPYAQLAYICEAEGSLIQAIENAKKAVEIDPCNLGRKALLINFLRKKCDFQTATALLQEYIKQYPHWSEPYAQLSAICETQAHIKPAIEYALKAMEVEPYNLNRVTKLANLYRRVRKFAEAETLMKKYSQKNPFWSEPYAQFSLIYETMGRMDKAIDMAKKAVEVDPYSLLRKIRLVQLYRKKEDFETAEVLINEELKRNPYWSEGYAQISAIHDAKGDIEEAINFANIAVEKEPCNLSRKYQLANLLRKKKDYEETERLANEWLKQYPHWSDPYCQIAYVREACYDLDSAISFLKKAIITDPRNQANYRSLALMQIKNGLALEAVQTIKASLAINPYQGWPYSLLADISGKLGKIDMAIQSIYKAMEIEPFNTGYKTQMLNLLRKKGDFEQIIRYVSRWLIAFPYWSEPYSQISLIYENKNDLSSAIIYAKKALDLEPYSRLRKNQYDKLIKKASV